MSFNKSVPLEYLGLPGNYKPDPIDSTPQFLEKHLSHLPPHILTNFSSLISPKDRTVITKIRNRRLKYSTKKPEDLSFTAAKNRWPELWLGGKHNGQDEGKDEKAWGENEFLSGTKQYVGKLGDLLGGYEEEREAERARSIRRKLAEEFLPEEDESSDEDESAVESVVQEESPEEARDSFERLIKERFIYGMLKDFEYDTIDWDENLDADDDREAEDRWFEEDDD